MCYFDVLFNINHFIINRIILMLSLCVAIVMFISCEKEVVDTATINQVVSKETYVNNFMSKLLDLPKEQMKGFKESLEFDDFGSLVSWDNALLREVYSIEVEYNKVLVSILAEIDDGNVVYPIYIIDGSNHEYIIDTNINLGVEYTVYGDDEEKDDSLKPVDKGTYIFQDQKNRLFSDGCKRSRRSTCIIKVT